MLKNSIIFLQAAATLTGIIILVLMLWEPNLEGRNAHATLFEIYFKDPFLAFAYIGSIPFFVALYKIFKVLGYVRQNKIFSPVNIKALQTIKNCVLITAGCIVAADIYLVIFMRGKDDFTGAVSLGMIATIILIIIANAAEVFKAILENAMNNFNNKDIINN